MRLVQIFLSIIALFFSFAATAQQGLLGEYYSGTNFETKVMTRVDARINFNWDRVSPAPGMNSTDYSIRWTGRLLAPKSGKYTFSAKVDDGIRVWVGGAKVIDAWGPHDSEDFSGSITLEANKHYDLKVDYFNGIFEGEIQLLWVLPGEGNALTNFFSSPAKPVDAKYLYQPTVSKPANLTPKPPVAKPENKPAKKNTPSKKAPPAKSKPAKPATNSQPSSDIPAPPATVTTTPEVKAKQRALELKYIYFERSKDIILPESRATLDDWVIFLQQQRPDAVIDIAGHTDDLGNEAKNQELSEKRAQIVADYLIEHSLDKSRIRAKGYGGAKPIYVNPATERDRALNRRVEIRVKQNK
ncbi:MAG: signaling protein [Haliscomenobacteraceae bacterium CHB4]|nr:hypothetical protein [Saprospiraceae bacterium]MCE7921471.1 signaling protein [Haliscomenobacteraceae bacterium CHB4]